MNETLMPGKYYLGDPSNVLPPKIFIGIWGDLYNFKNGKFNINTFDFAVHNTHNGDGTYTDTKNRTYNIKTGMFGLININLIDDLNECKYGHIFNFDNKINFIYDAGIFYIKSGKKYINIDTRNLEEYDSEFEEHCHNEDDEYICKTILRDSDNDSIIEEITDTYLSSDDDENKDNKEDINNKKITFFKKKN
jgi:hypothetical protein